MLLAFTEQVKYLLGTYKVPSTATGEKKGENTFLFLQACLSGFSLSYPTKSSELKIPSAPQLYHLFESYHIRTSFHFILVCGINLVKRWADLLRREEKLFTVIFRIQIPHIQSCPVFSHPVRMGDRSYLLQLMPIIWSCGLLRPFVKFFLQHSGKRRGSAVKESVI